MNRVACLVLVVLIVLGVACGDEKSSAARRDLAGRTFLSIDSDRTLVAGTRVRLQFVDGEIRADAGCNHLIGRLQLDGGRLTMSDSSSTEMGCDQDRHGQDDWLNSLLSGQPQWTLDGDTLTIADGTDAIVLVDREVADPDRPLEGTKWLVDGIITGDSVASVPIMSDVRAEVVFDAGRVTGNSGCNGFDGAARLEDGRIVIGEVVSELVACLGERGDLEDAVYAVVRPGSLRFEITAGRLTLTNDAGAGLMLRAVE